MELQKTYDDIFHAVKWRIQEDFEEEREIGKADFLVRSARLALRAGEALVRQSSDVQVSQGKSSAPFSRRITNASDMFSNSKSPSAGAKKARRRRIASSSKGTKNLLKVRRAGSTILM